ncbi:MAG: anaerobic ribonucleoside-triphosphate reductase activating protein [Burkholderiales bacterium]|nr:anaerobic ribonucleoside-triphosphate reductase activating protein [Burkholderiales bacterium]
MPRFASLHASHLYAPPDRVEEPLRVAGFTPLSTTDFPGQLAAVVFVQGCAWRCRYCHNPEIQARLEPPLMPWQAVLNFLDRRQGLLDAVVFCGGEPTVDRSLGRAIDDVRQRGFKVGLHTAGIYPDRLRQLLPKIDWVGFDVKAPFADYAETTGVRDSGTPARQSLDYLLASGVEHEVRTTLHPSLLSSVNLASMATALRQQGVATFALQEFRAHGCSDTLLEPMPPPLDDAGIDHLQKLFPTFILRRAS